MTPNVMPMLKRVESVSLDGNEYRSAPSEYEVPSVLVDEWLPNVGVIYVEDVGHGFRVLDSNYLSESRLTVDDVVKRSRACLREFLADVEVKKIGGGPARMVTLDGNFEATSLLDKTWCNELENEVGGPLVAAIPARDVLGYCSENDNAGVRQLCAMISRVWPGGDHLLTDRLLVRRNGVWMEL